MGRYLVASHDLPGGILLISEEALVVGPTQDSPPSCLGCYSSIPDITSCFRCVKCGWPLCSSRCKGLHKRHGHSKVECSQLENCQVQSSRLAQNQLYNAVVPLRCLLLREHDPDKWRTLVTMEAHNNIRRALPTIWDHNQTSVVDRIREDWNITRYSEEDIHTVCGFLEVNSFSIGDDSLNIRGLYPTAFLIAHTCVPNTSHIDDEEFRMRIFTSLPLLKDEMITLTYTNSLQGTKIRRENLKEGKFFECECSRCRDPTELGTYLSALKCHECGSGHLLPSDPLMNDSVWLCDNKRCRVSLPAAAISTVVSRIDREIKAIDQNSIEALETSISKYSNILHRNHFHIIGMKYTLSQLYGKSVGFLIHQMTETMLERKKQVCEDVLQIFDVLEPGLSRIRGVTMYELHAPIMVLTIKEFEERKISRGELTRRLKKVAHLLRDCTLILKFEKEMSQEGCIRAAADDALTQLKSWEPVVGKL